VNEAAPTVSRNTFLERIDNDRVFRLLVWFFGLTLLTFAAFPIANALLPGKSIKDYELWYDTGQRVVHGAPIYPGPFRKFPFMYPPACAIFFAPFSLLGQVGLVVALVLVNVAAWAASIVFAVRIATGEWRRAHPLLYAIPSALIAVYAWSNFHIGQPTLVLLALMLGAFVALQSRRQPIAGALIAIAAAVKAFPFVAIVYLLYRRYWIAAASLVLTLAFLLLVLPAPFRGLQQAATDLRLWTGGMLLKYDDTGMAQRPGRSNSWKNQSIFGVANRLLRHVDYDDRFGRHTPVYTNIADLSFKAVNRIIVGLALLCGLAYVAVMPSRHRRTRETDALEFACLVLLMLMFTPLSFGYLFASLLFPFTVVVQRLLTTRAKRLLVLTAIAVLLLALTVPAQRTAQALGNTFFATAILFVALALELFDIKRSGAEAAAAV
jgi:hypothetical protein